MLGWIKLVVVLFSAVGSFAGICPDYTTRNLTTGTDVCVVYDPTLLTYYVDTSVCNATKECYYKGFGINPETNIMCKPKLQPGTTMKSPKFPGEKCNNTTKCDSIYAPFGCKEGKCFGYSENEAFPKVPFNPSYACNPGLYFEGNYCVKQLLAGNNCTADYQCKNSYVCVNSVCTKIGSIKNGTVFDSSKSSKPHLACETLINSWINSTHSRCVNPVTLRGQAASCNSNQDCLGSNGQTTTCNCGLSGGSYCMLHLGDKLFQQATNCLKNWFLNGAHQCNTLRRDSEYCKQDYWEEKQNYQYYFYKASFYPWLKGAQPGVVQVFQQNYYQMQENYTQDSTAVLCLSSLVLFLLSNS